VVQEVTQYLLQGRHQASPVLLASLLNETWVARKRSRPGTGHAVGALWRMFLQRRSVVLVEPGATHESLLIAIQVRVAHDATLLHPQNAIAHS